MSCLAMIHNAQASYTKTFQVWAFPAIGTSHLAYGRTLFGKRNLKVLKARRVTETRLAYSRRYLLLENNPDASKSSMSLFLLGHIAIPGRGNDDVFLAL